VCGYTRFGEGVCGCERVGEIARAGNSQTKLVKVTITSQPPTCK
jgi:peptidylprolyl isomerase/peptidyl-prolyl cis-trans isomerase A (cyclophilin A)